jgi:endonuclease-3
MSKDHTQRAVKIIHILRKATQGMVEPASVTLTKKFGRNPYLTLISCILSLRTKDTVSLPASLRLFEHAQTPEQMVLIPVKTIEKLIYPCGFYRRKAVNIHEISQTLIDSYKSKVPDTVEGLMGLKGVGLKTANLVLGEGFGIPALCVDTHVHRISNRLGFVRTDTPEETERELKNVLPPEHWIEFNHLMVMWGQNVCVPISPFCSRCVIKDMCPQIGVTRSR